MRSDKPTARSFAIVGRTCTGQVQQTRVQAASAILLAQNWMRHGYEDVCIVDPDGQPCSVDAIRHRYLARARIASA